jgi:hypothetical protein
MPLPTMRKSGEVHAVLRCCYPTIRTMPTPPPARRAPVRSTSALGRHLSGRDRAWAAGALDRPGSTPPGCRSAASSCRARPSGGCTASVLRRPGEKSRSSSRRGAVQTLATVGPASTTRSSGRADRGTAPHRGRRRRHRRHGGIRAATYLRGVPVVQVPTTLLAQVDSAIGGKVGREPRAGQEPDRRVPPAVGRRHRPRLLATLPRREFRAGLYEVVKYGVIAAAALFDRRWSGSPRALRARARGLCR